MKNVPCISWVVFVEVKTNKKIRNISILATVSLKIPSRIEQCYLTDAIPNNVAFLKMSFPGIKLKILQNINE